TEARDKFTAAQILAARFRTSLSKDDAAKIEAALADTLAALGKAQAAEKDSARAEAMKGNTAAIETWRDSFGQEVTITAARTDRINSWTKNEGEPLANGANALREEGVTAAASTQKAVEATISNGNMTVYIAAAFALLVGIALSLLLARSITGPLS